MGSPEGRSSSLERHRLPGGPFPVPRLEPHHLCGLASDCVAGRPPAVLIFRCSVHEGHRHSHFLVALPLALFCFCQWPVLRGHREGGCASGPVLGALGSVVFLSVARASWAPGGWLHEWPCAGAEGVSQADGAAAGSLLLRPS